MNRISGNAKMLISSWFDLKTEFCACETQKRTKRLWTKHTHTHTPVQTATVCLQVTSLVSFVRRLSVSQSAVRLCSERTEKCQFVGPPPASSQPSLHRSVRFFQVEINKCLTEGLGFTREPFSRAVPRGFRVKEGAVE